MAKHEVTYDSDGLSTCDPWTLYEYLHEDGLSPAEQDKVAESVLSWLREYDNAGVDLHDAMQELAKEEDT